MVLGIIYINYGDKKLLVNILDIKFSGSEIIGLYLFFFIILFIEIFRYKWIFSVKIILLFYSFWIVNVLIIGLKKLLNFFCSFYVDVFFFYLMKFYFVKFDSDIFY